MTLHDDRCASHKGHPCNCPAAAFKPPTVQAEPTIPYVCPACQIADPNGKAAHERNFHMGAIAPVQAAAAPDLVAILADYFTGPDLALCSLAMAAQDETTARRRAERFFKARDAFGIPRETDIPNHARDYIIHALSVFIAPSN